MQRVKIALSYDGNYFYGFQIQRGSSHTTVAGVIEKALKKLGITCNVTGSGRTDKGVHASEQVIHLDIPDFWEDLTKLQTSVNFYLHPHIHIKKISAVNEDFHARFFAKKRLYRYLLYTGSYKPFYTPYALHVDENLDCKKLDLAMKSFVGEHSFAYFKKEGSQTHSDIRKIYKAGAYRHKEFIILHVKGNSFLRSQVRMMSAFSLSIAKGKLTQDDLEEQLTCKKMHLRKLAPACGLYLSRVYY